MIGNLNPVLLRIDELCRQYNWTHYKIAKAADIPLASFNSMFKRNTSPTIPTLEKICEGFQISMRDFFDYEIQPDTMALEPDARILLDRYSSLSKNEKRLLLAYLDGLQRIDYSIPSEEPEDK